MIVTGAGRGFGRAAAAAFASRVRLPLHLVLVGRSEKDLADTAALCQASRGGRELQVRMVQTGDLSLSSEAARASLESVTGDMFREAGLGPAEGVVAFSDVTLVDNAGTIGPIAPLISNSMSLDLISQVATLNYVVPAYLTTEFVKRFSSSPSVLRLTVAHVSSLWAVQAQSCFATYCSSKAGIEMFLRVLAEEHSHKPGGSTTGPSVRVLNYAPGPLDTDMQLEIRSAPELDGASRQVFLDMKEGTRLVAPAVSAEKFARLVIEELFESGAHVDFYDEVVGIEKPLLRQTTCCACTYCECGPACQCKPQGKPQCDSCAVFVAEAKGRSETSR